MKRKLTFSVPVVADDNSLSTQSGITATIMKHGAQFRSAFTITPSASLSLPMWSAGGIPNNASAEVLHVAADGAIKPTDSMTMTTGGIADAAGGVTITLSTGAGASISVAKDDWLVHDYASSTYEAALYEGPTSTTVNASNPITLDSSGLVEVWTDEPIVDIYVAGTGITEWYFIGIKTEAADIINVDDHFGAAGDGTTEDTAAIQSAMDYANANGIRNVEFNGDKTYIVEEIQIHPEVSLYGNGCNIKQKAGVANFTRIFDTTDNSWSSSTDSELMVIDGFNFDGNASNQGSYSAYQLEQNHALFLTADPASAGRLNVNVSNCSFKDTTGDGVSIYTNVNANVSDCHFYDCFRGGLVITGGYTNVNSVNTIHDGATWPSGIDVEATGAGANGYGSTNRVEISISNAKILNGEFQIAVEDDSSASATNVIMEKGYYGFSSWESAIQISNSRLVGGMPGTSFLNANLVWGNNVKFVGVDFEIGTDDVFASETSGAGNWARETFSGSEDLIGLRVQTQSGGTANPNAKIILDGCTFRLRSGVSTSGTIYGIYAIGAIPSSNNNELHVLNTVFENGACDEDIHFQTANKLFIDNVRFGGTHTGMCPYL